MRVIIFGAMARMAGIKRVDRYLELAFFVRLTYVALWQGGQESRASIDTLSLSAQLKICAWLSALQLLFKPKYTRDNERQ